ncbi:MAG: AI-2E family transporter, partial [Candidatus Magasanikbacteria bacterium]|nr:AI-2E family transporter [Candidatus Magasanikbacteria bacterium]
MPVSKHVMSFHRLRSIFYFVLLGIFGALLLYVVRPFFYPIFWAAVIAIMFYPVYVWLTHHTKMPSVSSLLSVMIVVATLLVPMVLISVLVVYQTSDLYDTVSQNNFF